MATKTSLLLIPVTLSFVFVLAALGAQATNVAVIYHGVVQCSNSPSTVISNAPLQVVVNGTTVMATGQTTITGRFLITVKASSAEQLISLVNDSTVKAVSTAPPLACGASGGTVVKLDDAPIALNGYTLLGEISKAKLISLIQAISSLDLTTEANGDVVARRGLQQIAGSVGLLNDDVSVVIDMGRGGRDIVNEGLFVYVLSVAVVGRD